MVSVTSFLPKTDFTQIFSASGIDANILLGAACAAKAGHNLRQRLHKKLNRAAGLASAPTLTEGLHKVHCQTLCKHGSTWRLIPGRAARAKQAFARLWAAGQAHLTPWAWDLGGYTLVWVIVFPLFSAVVGSLRVLLGGFC